MALLRCMEAQVSLTVAFSSSAFFEALAFSFSSRQYSIVSLWGSDPGEFAGQSSTPTPWSFNQLCGCFWQVLGRCQIHDGNKLSIFNLLTVTPIFECRPANVMSKFKMNIIPERF